MQGYSSVEGGEWGRGQNSYTQGRQTWVDSLSFKSVMLALGIYMFMAHFQVMGNEQVFREGDLCVCIC